MSTKVYKQLQEALDEIMPLTSQQVKDPYVCLNTLSKHHIWQRKNGRLPSAIMVADPRDDPSNSSQRYWNDLMLPKCAACDLVDDREFRELQTEFHSLEEKNISPGHQDEKDPSSYKYKSVVGTLKEGEFSSY